LPDVTIPPAPNTPATLTFNPAWSFWISDRIYLASYDVADSEIAVPDIRATVTGCRRCDFRDGRIGQPLKDLVSLSGGWLDTAGKERFLTPVRTC
jgi:hypothetical protein